jgi:nicotinamidase/pyrazinamidase
MTPLVFWDVDTQRDFMEPHGALHVPGAEVLLPRLRQLTGHARSRRIPVVASVCAHGETDDELSAQPDYRRTFPTHCLRGTRGQEKVPATAMCHPVVIENRPYDTAELTQCLAGAPTQILVEKQHFDVFSNPATETLLAVMKIRLVIVYGVATDVCVHHAVVGLARRGCRVRVAEDATAALDPAAAARCVAVWRQLGVTLTTTDAVLQST